MKTFAAVVGIAVLSLTGCAVNGFQKFYTPVKIPTTAHLLPASGDPDIYTLSDDPKSDVLRAQEAGYVVIGNASFYGPEKVMTKAQLLEQAKSVGDSMVLVRSKHRDTISGVIPYTTVNPNQVSTVNTTGTVSNGYGTSTYNGHSTVTTPGGTTTNMIPYSVNRDDAEAVFFAQIDPRSIRLGVIYVPLPNDLRTKLERNTGLLAPGIIKGTPAFNANILPGDVIVSIGGENVIDREGFSAQLESFAGRAVDIGLIRGDQPRTIHVTLNRGVVH